MKQRHGIAAALALAIVAAGCSGSDGAQGPQGPQGLPGRDGVDATATPSTTEACRGCHGQFAAKHALSDAASVLVTLDPTKAVTVSGNDIVVKFNVKVNGVNSDDFQDKASVVGGHVEDAWWVYYATSTSGDRTKIQPGNWTLSWNGSGNYTATLTGVAAMNSPMGMPAAAPGTMFLLNTRAPGGLVATIVAHYPVAYGAQAGRRDTVTNEACMACHGRFVRNGAIHDLTNAPGIDACIVCHNRFGAVELRLAGSYTAPVAGMEGSGLMGLIHGIHNSANMPDAEYAWTWTNGTSGAKFSFSFPGYVNNCATCHTSATNLADIASRPFSYGLCVSCHDGFSGFSFANAANPTTTKNNHLALTAVSGCGCHSGETVADRHNGLKTERSGLIWAGADQSVAQGKRVAMTITGATFEPGTPGTIVVTWKAAVDGVDVDPCNTVATSSAPIFHRATANASTGQSASNFSILKAYGIGNDWVNGISGVSSPGQPTSVNLSSTNTSCSANVATTRVAADNLTAAAVRAAVALQGKPQLRFDPAAATSFEVIQVRAKSPVKEFVPATGAAPTARRQIISMDKCNGCHNGSMYQHGGNRVDAIELCVMCHNPASTEQQTRQNYGVTAAEAYDGKPGQTYDMRTMIHAIHSAGETGNPYVIYRTRGIYLFGNDSSLAAANWPAESACVSCNGAEGPALYCKIAGSSASGNLPVAGGSCTGGAASTDGTWQAFVYTPVHYPRLLNDCAACHINGSEKQLPDPTKAVAVTVDMGASIQSLIDDTLMGPTAATCLSCHQYSTDLVKAQIRAHAYDNGWWPAVFTNGRQTLIDAAP